ncbi:winged helix-turn-helix transcriptional regulator [Sphingobacterium sp. LRF_L2]|uniref:winged helix-turn-helix transcriptional regulator n=1 Tax=Sphingobacterium sp. LRF_L2 TaxID=3369421 RepID=UPI003F606DC9
MEEVTDNVLKRTSSCSEKLMALRDSLYVLGGKWKLMILRYLSNRTDRLINFKSLQRGIEGISAKMLSKELKELEANHLITRTVQETKPLSVTYAVTDYGKSVFPVTEILIDWGMTHRLVIRNSEEKE